jgi:LCP family protein required for cell wall assembly
MRTQPRSGKRHVLRWVAVAAVVIVAAATLTAYLKYRAIYDSITRVAVPSTALGHRPPVYSANSLNILVYGDDSRKGLDPHEQYILHTGHDQTDNTDTIMLVHISPGRHRVTVLSIPRDTMVPTYQCDGSPGYAGQQANPSSSVQINSLLQIGGPTCLWKTIEQQTGIRIDHFIGIGMLGFVKVVDDLGGVNVCVPFNVNDPVSGLKLNSGEQHINGIQALAFWRTREDIGTGSDLERIQRDQFMSAQVVKGVLHSGLLSNPLRLLSVVTDAAASLTTDNGTTVSDLVQIAESLRTLPSQDVQFVTAPNEPWPADPARVQFAQPQADQVFTAIAHDVTVPKAPAKRTGPSSGGAQVLTTPTARPPHPPTPSPSSSAGPSSSSPGSAGASSSASPGASSSASPGASSSASPGASPSSSGVAGLAQSNGGITAAAACASDSSAFSGPLSP